MGKKSKKSKKSKKKDEEIEMVDLEEPQDEQTSEELAEEEYQSNKKKFRASLWSTIWIVLAIATIAFNILAFSTHMYCATSKADERSFCQNKKQGPTGVLIVALVVAIVVSLAVIYYQCQIEDTESLRNVQNEIRDQVNDFALENARLANSNTKLEKHLKPLKKSQKKLKKIAKKNGATVKKLQNLVKTNQHTIDEMRELVKADAVHQMIEAVLESDRSEDGEFSDQEIRQLGNRLDGLPSVVVNKELFLKKIKADRSINAVVKLVRTIHDETIPDKKRVFKMDDEFDPKDLFEGL